MDITQSPNTQDAQPDVTVNMRNEQQFLVDLHNTQVETAFHTQFAFFSSPNGGALTDDTAQLEALKHVPRLWALVSLSSPALPKTLAFRGLTDAINTDAGVYSPPMLRPPDMPSSPIGQANPLNPGVYNTVASMVGDMPFGMPWEDDTGKYVLEGRVTPFGRQTWWMKTA